jgi:hypothetical protein
MSTLRTSTLLIVIGLVALVYGLAGILTAWPPAPGKVREVKIPAATNIERVLVAMDLPYTVVPSPREAPKESSLEYRAFKIETQDEFLSILGDAKGFADNKIEKTLSNSYRFDAGTRAAYVYKVSIPKIRTLFMHGEGVELPPDPFRFGMSVIKTPSAGDTEFSVRYSQKIAWFMGWFLGGIILVIIFAFIVPMRPQRGPHLPSPPQA